MEAKQAYPLSEEEFREIEDLYERKLALENLAKIIDPSQEQLYEKLISDYGSTTRKFNAWWEQMSEKYNLNSPNWYVNFDSQMIEMQE